MRLALAASLLVFSFSSAAFADVPPGPPPSQGPECTVQAQQRPGEQCQECAASYETPNKCQTELGSRGLSQRCRGPGASVWHEVWCNGAGGAPPPAEKKGCAACSVGSTDDASGIAIALAGVLCAGAALRRARR
jgi:MYXO-CTERM domain-containing protein